VIRLPPSPQREPGEPVIPLINIVFLLLIFFMLAGEINRHGDIELIAPTAHSAESGALTDADHLALRADGSLWLDGRTLDGASGAARLAELAAGNDSAVLFADASVPTARLLAVLDALRSAGFARVSLMTRARQAPP
jgi:biopolymer transport protein ExbD